MTPKKHSVPVFGFEKALKLMKRGRKVRRASWTAEEGPFVWLEFRAVPLLSKNGELLKPGATTRHLCAVTEKSASPLFEVTHSELFATDWYEVDPPLHGRSKKPIRPGRTGKPAT